LQLAHRCDFDFRLNRKPVAVKFKGKPIRPVVFTAGAGYIVSGLLTKPGVIDFEF